MTAERFRLLNTLNTFILSCWLPPSPRPVPVRSWHLSVQGLCSLPGLFRNVALCALLAGFGLSTLYPIAIGFFSEHFGAVAPRTVGGMFAFSALGGASVLWMVDVYQPNLHV